jgi:CheY-like chemotaxis protein
MAKHNPGLSHIVQRDMPRPTLLVAEPEPEQALSVRKLVLETGKFNVLTAHSTLEGLDIFQLFPNISAAVLVGDSNIDCDEVGKHIKSATDTVHIIYLHASIGGRCAYADHHLSSHEPEALLELVRSLLGDPRSSSEEGLTIKKAS